MPAIALATLNAKYIHASMGLRCILANMDRHGAPGLRAQTALFEFVIEQRPIEIVEVLLAQPDVRIVAFGVYIWNVEQTTSVVRLLRTLRPDLCIVLGGPEVSHEIDAQAICALANYIVTGWGDVSVPGLCNTVLNGTASQRAVLPKVIAGIQPPLDELNLPYDEYTDEDIAHRLLYVEASRGCPFKCEFCLSSLDKTAWAFDLDVFLQAMQRLVDRGATVFKFVDRTFNLKIEASARILQFFLDHIAMGKRLYAHFELVPDVLPERLKALIARFPPGHVQFEIGIQTFTPEVQKTISRKQDEAKTEANLRWLREESPAHLHTDLIFGLPGETLESFAASFDQLVRLRPHEVQFGMLKRLRGTPIIRHTQAFDMRYDPLPPYTVLQTSTFDFATVQRVGRMARYWEMVANNHRFAHSTEALLGLNDPEPTSPFARFMAFADWMWAHTHKTHAFAAEKLYDLLFAHLCSRVDEKTVRNAIHTDWQHSGHQKLPQCLIGHVDERAMATQRLQNKRARLRQQQQAA